MADEVLALVTLIFIKTYPVGRKAERITQDIFASLLPYFSVASILSILSILAEFKVLSSVVNCLAFAELNNE